MPFGYGGGPWWAYNQRDLRSYWGRCFRYPWRPRWWWAYPENLQEPSPKEEKEMLTEELNSLNEEMGIIKKRLKELENKKKR